MSLYDETNFILKKYSIKANKALGQNFLVDETAVNAIVDASNITKEELVIEIGPGLGVLTERLLNKAKKVVCIELDEKMVNILNEKFKLYDNIEIINEDVLKVNIEKIIEEEKEKNSITKVKVVANLPYYITTPIIMKLLEDRLSIDMITIMIQKEVADRLIANPGDKNCGAITYAINYYAASKKVIDVTKNAFIPVPAVDSTVISLEIRPTNLEISDEKLFFRVIKSSFMQRRKTLLNALSNANVASKEILKEMFGNLEFDEKIRGERLSLKDFANISNYLSKSL